MVDVVAEIVEVVSRLVELVEVVVDDDDHGDNAAFCPHTKLGSLRPEMMVECIDANSAAIIYKARYVGSSLMHKKLHSMQHSGPKNLKKTHEIKYYFREIAFLAVFPPFQE